MGNIALNKVNQLLQVSDLGFERWHNSVVFLCSLFHRSDWISEVKVFKVVMMLRVRIPLYQSKCSLVLLELLEDLEGLIYDLLLSLVT